MRRCDHVVKKVTKIYPCKSVSVQICDLQKMDGVTILVILATVGIATAQSDESFDRESILQCARAHSNNYCPSTLNSLQNQARVAQGCDQGGLALNLATECARDPGLDVYCSVINFFNGELFDLASNCTGGAIFGVCSDGCADRLQFLRSNLGCCINARINTTVISDNLYGYAQHLFTNDYWETCGVDPVTTTCENILPFTDNPVAPNELSGINCEYSSRITDAVLADNGCTEESFAKVRAAVSAVTDENNNSVQCDVYENFIRDSCRVDARNQLCIAPESPESDFNNYLGTIPSACSALLVEPFECPADCRSVLQKFADNRGCCVNALYNSTQSVVVGISNPFLQRDPVSGRNIYEFCGLESPPQMCDLYTATGGATRMKSFTFMLLIPLIGALISLFVY